MNRYHMMRSALLVLAMVGLMSAGAARAQDATRSTWTKDIAYWPGPHAPVQ